MDYVKLSPPLLRIDEGKGRKHLELLLAVFRIVAEVSAALAVQAFNYFNDN